MGLLDTARFRSLVTVQRGSGGAPFFCVHGAGGNVLNFRELSRGMKAGRPFFGLQARGVDGVRRPHDSVAAMARAYIDEIRGLQPQGPYLIGGYSAGGLVAFEMAHRLTALGERVGLLALIDTMHPDAPNARMTVATRLRRLRDEGLGYVLEAVGRRREDARRQRALHIVRRRIAQGEPIPFALRDVQLTHNFRQAARAYCCKPWAGSATLFRAEEIPIPYRDAGPAYGWDRFILGGVAIVTIPGNHKTVLLGDNALPLGRALDAAIERAIAIG